MSFFTWMTYAFPVSFALILPIWIWISRSVDPKLQVELPQTGRWKPAEIRTLIVFTCTALLWMTRKDPFGGWSSIPCFNYLSSGETISNYISDGVVALSAVIVMFCIPSGNGHGERLLDWKTARKIPWEMLILVSAGIALGKAFKDSGLSETIASSLENLKGVHLLILIFLIAVVVSFLTEMTSNTATANLLMPILSAAAVANEMHPGMMMFPAVISCSCAFMLPVATIPNAVVFATERIPIRRMAQEGIILNILGAMIIALGCYFFLSFD